MNGVAVATVLKAGETPTFVYDHGKTDVHLGTLFPTEPREATMRLAPLVITPALQQSVKRGQSFIIVYGRISYDDVFGGHHWLQFCAPGAGGQYGNPPECLDYNNVDDNETP